jgi:hypothetical protein
MKLKVDFNNCRPAEPCAAGEEARCLCGGLVARLVDGGVELKCRRCRRILVVPLEAQRGVGRAAEARR